MITMDVETRDGGYCVHIMRGIIGELGNLMEDITQGQKIALITDTNVGALYGERVEDILISSGFNVEIITLEAGEQSKSIEVLRGVYTDLLSFNLTRQDCILTLGGGVVGDLGGFAAATFLRGVPYVQVPTSLLAQVDSSVGGKVAVDLPQGKNLIGSFYHPKAVFIDPNSLETLPTRFFNDGMAEVIKYGCIADEALFERVAEVENREDLVAIIEQIISRSLEIKRDLVEEDEFDTGSRKKLNFGHTFGHAVERHFDYTGFTHGEAVAIGMHQITKNSEEMGLTERGTCERIRDILIKHQLPYEISCEDSVKALESMAFDKKVRGCNIDLVILEAVGEAFTREVCLDRIQEYFIGCGE